MLRLLRTYDYQRSRWKNDGGWTTEIASEPKPDGGGGLNWRVSIADIEVDGPFSIFPGMERDLLLLSGKGIELDINEAAPARLDQRFQKIHFRGEDSIDCRLLAGPTRDFNVMTARERVSAEVHARPLNGIMLIFADPQSSWLIHVFAGSAEVRGNNQSLQVKAGETLLIDPSTSQRERIVIDGGGELILVKFIQARV